MKTKSIFKLENKRHALVPFWISVVMCLMCAASIVVAELFMPENYHGQKGVLTFYRVFGSWFICEGAIALWSYIESRRIY